jgi:hypothetical protein
MYAISISTTAKPTAINPNSTGTPRAGLVAAKAAAGTSARSRANPITAFAINNNAPPATNAGRDGLGSVVVLEMRADYFLQDLHRMVVLPYYRYFHDIVAD